MEKQRLLEQLEAYSKMEEGESRTITADILDTIEEAKNFIKNGFKDCYEYWEKLVRDYIECRYDYDEIEQKLNKLSESDLKKFYDKMNDGLLNDDIMWGEIDTAIECHMFGVLNEYEEESGE